MADAHKRGRIFRAVCCSIPICALSSFLQAIFELSRGEQDLIEDLQLARKVCVLKYPKQWEYIQNPINQSLAASAAGPSQEL